MLRLLLTATSGAQAVAVATPDTVLASSYTRQGIVIAPGSSGAFDETLVESPAVWWDPTEGKWGMVYTGYDPGPTHAKIGLAWSDDLLTWTKDAASPILAGSGSGTDSAGCTGPFVWLEGGTYYLFYIGLTATGYEGGTKTLNLATASAITGPWTRHGAVISPTSGWRNSAIWHPNVVKDGSIYYLFFNASGSQESIGYATSSDLVTWTVDDVNSPVLSASSAWESTTVGDPCLFLDGGWWYMAYYGNSSAPKDGWAYTTVADFPVSGWTRWSGNPVLSGSGSGWDSAGAGKPFIVRTGGVEYHFYSGDMGSFGNRQIGLATRPI